VSVQTLAKTMSGRKRERDFFRQTIRRALSCYVLLFTDFVNFGQSRVSGLNLAAFINSTS